MAEDTEQSSKTEEASPQKLEAARQRGEIAKTADLPAWASLTAAASVIAIAGGWMCYNLAAALTPFVAHPDAFELANGGAVRVMRQALGAAAPAMVAVIGSAALAGAAGNLVQHGFVFTPSKLMPDASRLSPQKGFERVFGLDGLVQFVKSFLKILLVCAIAWAILKPHAEEFQILPELDVRAMLPLACDMLRALVFSVLAVLGVGALIDWFWQRLRFMQRMRMTKQEQKEDFRQNEGDPHVKARLRQIRTERGRRRMMQNVPKATVVVMNPTHYAVALRYDAAHTPAPLCVAKGVDSLALKIREVAEAHGVSVIEDAPLARALYATVEIDEVIPRQHYEAVAKVIGFVLQGARRGRGRPSAGRRAN
jgi:flagellar biosynthetic protein FlhB